MATNHLRPKCSVYCRLHAPQTMGNICMKIVKLLNVHIVPDSNPGYIPAINTELFRGFPYFRLTYRNNNLRRMTTPSHIATFRFTINNYLIIISNYSKLQNFNA
jgi:hypothetical protein